ncbi:MAG: GIY-YIG nuclease family protein [Acidobacteria bacterium]|nr:GIY-YIG nuclease family protein [Acidobacteriota bacterium]
MNDYYVYVYIDPRNHEEFYYGKGVGSRRSAHLDDQSHSDKAKRIAEIQKEGLTPIVRVIARGLSEAEALLVEKTLLWKLAKWTTNISTGHFADKFWPHNTLHKELSGFDFRNGLYYYNVGEGTHRNWDDQVEFGFISAGQGARWRKAMLGFNEGDVVAAYLKRRGFVGIGKILSRASRIKDVKIKGRPLLQLPLRCRRMADNCDDVERSEYVCRVEWLASEPREQAKWRAAPKLYTTTHVRASLDGQPETMSFLEREFKVSIREVIA